MSPTISILYMFLISIPIGYVTMPAILGVNSPFLRTHLNKIYGAFLMAFTMAFAELLMHLNHMRIPAILTWLVIISAGIALSYSVIREQTAITEKQFLDGMIEHHGMAVVMSQKVLARPDVGSETKFLADQILKTQIKEIALMNQIGDRLMAAQTLRSRPS
jgi:hypothetical protein